MDLLSIHAYTEGRTVPRDFDGVEKKTPVVVRAKWCARCDKYLPAAAFSPYPGSSTGLSSWCRECAVAATREWRAANPEKIATYNEARRLAYREAHPLVVGACSECGEERSLGSGRASS